jgi:hypothetical protein
MAFHIQFKSLSNSISTSKKIQFEVFIKCLFFSKYLETHSSTEQVAFY